MCVVVVGRFAGSTGLDVIAEGVQGNCDLATGLVDPLADLRGLVDCDTGGNNDGCGDDDAFGQWRRHLAAVRSTSLPADVV